MRDYCEECCRSCKFNKYYNGEFLCGNEDSEMYGIYTEHNDSCDEYEEK